MYKWKSNYKYYRQIAQNNEHAGT